MVRNIFEGSEFLIYDIDDNPIALSKNCKLQVKQSTTDITTKDSKNWNESLTTVKDWSIEFAGLVSYNEDKFNTKYFLDQYNNSEPFFVQFGVLQNDFNHTYWGEVLLESIDLEASNGEVVSYSGKLKGVGELEFTNEGSPEQRGYIKVELDPVFRASPAFNISQLEINNWNEASAYVKTKIEFVYVSSSSNVINI